MTFKPATLCGSSTVIAVAYIVVALLLVFGPGRIFPAPIGTAPPFASATARNLAVRMLAFAFVSDAGLFWLLRRLRRETMQIAELHAANAIAAAAVASSRDGVLTVDLRQPGLPLVEVNPAFEAITGYPAHEAIGKNCRYLQGSDRLQPEIAHIREAIAQCKAATVTLRNYRKDGAMFWNELQLAPVFDSQGAATHYVGLMRDVTQLHETTMRLQRALHLDPLTGVANRPAFHEQLQAMLHDDAMPSVLLAKLDVSGFHLINTSFGYDVGDALLRQIAERLRRWPDVLLGRLAADEFGFAMRLADPTEADGIVRRLWGTLAEKFTLPGAAVEVRFALGYAVGRPGDAAVDLVKQVAIALQESKSARPREIRRFDRRTAAMIRNRVRLTTELTQAVAASDLVLYYQPKVSLATGALVGAEALARWVHPLFGLQSPDLFIPIAEETGLILDIGDWALRTAASLACRVNQDRSTPLGISVNVSPLQFMHRELEPRLRAVLETTGANPAWLTLELTESVFTEASPELIAVMQRIRALGCGLAIDDFGSGYSSLRYLDSFPLTEIKIDRHFVAGLHAHAFRRAVVDAVVRLGKELGASVTAEGVEADADRRVLLDLGCPFAQGFAFGRPMPEEAYVRLVSGGGPGAGGNR